MSTAGAGIFIGDDVSDKLAYSVKEAAEMLSISPWLLKEQIQQGRIQSVPDRSAPGGSALGARGMAQG